MVLNFLVTLLLALAIGVRPVAAQSYAVTPFAGSDWVGDQGPATQALLFQAEGLVTDPAGSLYIADAQAHRVRQVTPAGLIRTIAGTGEAGFSGDGGPASAAQLSSPYGLAMDQRGNLYIADLGNACVRRVAPDGTIATIASAPMIAPRNVAVDSNGVLYISDFGGQRVFKIGSDGVLVPVVSSGVRYPTALAIDRTGVLYIADSGNRLIRKFDRGVLTTVASAATPTGLAFDAAGTLYIADPAAGQIVKIAPGGGFLGALPMGARDLAFGPDGSLYASAATMVRKLLPGPASLVAGGGNPAFGDQGEARQARLNHPAAVAADRLGNVYIADRGNNRIRRVAPDGIITTVAGTGAQGSGGDNGPATVAQMDGPSSVSLDASGTLYVADTGNHRVRKFTLGGILLPVAEAFSPVDAAVDAAGNAYIADVGAHRIYWALPTGVVVPLLDGFDPGGVALDRDGSLYYSDPAAGRVWRRDAGGRLTELGAGRWMHPRGLAVSDSNELYVADSGLGRVLRVDASGMVTELIVDASLGIPWDVALGPAGTLYLADPDGGRVRKLTPVSAAPLATLGAVNAATMLPGPLAPGMLVAIRGAGVNPAGVFFAGVPARILASDDSRILVQVPPQIAGLNEVAIEVGNQRIMAQVADAAPALFTSGASQAAAVNEDGDLNSAAHPVARGSWISLYGTGEGTAGLPVSVRVGGYAAEVLYAGAVEGFPGLFQINARVPSGYVPTGILNVVVTVGQAESPPGVTIAVN